MKEDLVEIIELKGDGGWYAKGSLFGYRFTASLPAAGWNSKGWRVFLVSSLEDREKEDAVLYKIKNHLDIFETKGRIGQKEYFIPSSEYFKEGEEDMSKKKAKKPAITKTAATATKPVKKEEIKKETKAVKDKKPTVSSVAKECISKNMSFEKTLEEVKKVDAKTKFDKGYFNWLIKQAKKTKK